jgi:hypothetical protein
VSRSVAWCAADCNLSFWDRLQLLCNRLNSGKPREKLPQCLHPCYCIASVQLPKYSQALNLGLSCVHPVPTHHRDLPNRPSRARDPAVLHDLKNWLRQNCLSRSRPHPPKNKNKMCPSDSSFMKYTSQFIYYRRRRPSRPCFQQQKPSKKNKSPKRRNQKP